MIACYFHCLAREGDSRFGARTYGSKTLLPEKKKLRNNIYNDVQGIIYGWLPTLDYHTQRIYAHVSITHHNNVVKNGIKFQTISRAIERMLRGIIATATRTTTCGWREISSNALWVQQPREELEQQLIIIVFPSSAFVYAACRFLLHNFAQYSTTNYKLIPSSEKEREAPCVCIYGEQFCKSWSI
jgi:hypothetical protein